MIVAGHSFLARALSICMLGVIALPRPMWPCCGDSSEAGDIHCCESICNTGHGASVVADRCDDPDPADSSSPREGPHQQACGDCIAPCCAKIVAQTGPVNSVPLVAEIDSVSISSEARPDGWPADGVFHPPRSA